MIIRANIRDATYIAANMRDEDWAEISCQLPDGVSKTYVGQMCIETSSIAFTASYRDEPTGLFGFSPTPIKSLWSAWAFGTKNMWRVIPEISRHCVLECLPELVQRGAMRCEVRVMQAHDQSYRWLRRMGCRYECLMPYYGKNGETFALMAWDKDHMPEKYNEEPIRKAA